MAMKTIFTFAFVLITYVAIYAQTPITITNGDFEDLTPMAKNSNDKWAIKGFFLTDVLLTPAGIYVNDANSGLAPGQGDGGSQAFKVAVVQPDATSSSTYQVVALSTEPLDISNREFGRYTHKFYLKPGESLNAKRPFTFTYIITDANGADVTAFTSTVDDVARQALNATSDFKAAAATAGYQPLYSIVDIKANTNTDPQLGSVLNAKYITFQFNIGKNLNLNTALLTNTYFFDNFTLDGPAAKVTLSNDATLSSLTLNNGTISPAFSSAQLNYTVVLPQGTTTVPTVSATTTHANATKVITQATNLTGTETERKATVEVTAEDGNTKSTYTVVFSIASASSTDATLSSLTLNNGTLSPAFSAAQLNYTVVLPQGTTTVPTVSATTTHANATKVVTQATNLTGTETERKATVEVTAEDGATKSTSSIVFSVAKSTDATLTALTLSSGTLSPAFSSATLNYAVALPQGTSIVPTVSATTTHANATKVITQATNLTGTEAERKATVEVTAEDGATKSTYSIVFSVLTAIKENALNEKVKMYPNPVTDIVNIDIEDSSSKTSEIIIFNSLGMILKREKLNSGNAKIEVSSYQSGLYHVVIMSNDNVEWKGSFVKIK